MKIKVCGMRDPANIAGVVELPIDYLGMIFYNKSKRFVSKASFLEIPANLLKVGVFVDELIEVVKEKVIDYQLDMIQLHGKEMPSYCQRLHREGYRLIKAFPVDDQFDFSVTFPYEGYCDYFLFDTKGSRPGGNGEVFNWHILKNYKGKVPFFLAGGLSAGMGRSLKEFNHPKFYGIDLNSGFEVSPAIKDIEKLKSFLYELRS